MRARAGIFVLVFGSAVAGCTCGGGRRGTADGGTSEVGTSSTTESVSAASGTALFSRPVAAARVEGGAVVVAGLVANRGALVAQRIEAGGRVAWTKDLATRIVWTADAELKALPLAEAASAVVISFRGSRGGAQARFFVVVHGDGRVDPAVDVDGGVCATDDGVAWTERAPGGRARVHLRAWGAGAADVRGALLDEDFALVCGAKRAFAVVAGDDDAPAKIYTSPGPQTPLRTLADPLLRRDEERDLLPFTDGDVVGVVRITAGGAVQVEGARTNGAGVLAPDAARVPIEDDVVAIDADPGAVHVVFTRDEGEGCRSGKDEGATVRALRIPRDASSPTTSELARLPCGVDPGPFWTGVLKGVVVVGWAEHAPRAAKSDPPVSGFAYRALDGASPLKRVALPSDAIVDAGCSVSTCYAAALVRPPGSDGMQPEAMRIVTYP